MIHWDEVRGPEETRERNARLYREGCRVHLETGGPRDYSSMGLAEMTGRAIAAFRGCEWVETTQRVRLLPRPDLPEDPEEAWEALRKESYEPAKLS
jgi:hypothetical protein